MKTLNYYQIGDRTMLKLATAALFLVFSAAALTPGPRIHDVTRDADCGNDQSRHIVCG